jgi:hypothetical protein
MTARTGQPSGRAREFLTFTLRVVIVHTITYFALGMIMSNLLRYGEVFEREIIRDFMLSIDEHNILFGPFLQPVRGLIFAVGLWPIRSLLIERKRGWLVLWGLLVTIGILSTPAASPGSVEGMLYTRLPMWYHFIGYPEILLQTLLFSVWLVWWERRSAEVQPATAKAGSRLAGEVVKSLTAACFAWIGYAVAGLTLAAAANARAAATGGQGIDIGAAGANLKMQLMFVVAFAVNAIAVFFAARLWRAGRIRTWSLFLLFWFVDALVPWLYQTLVLGGSNLATAAMLGLLPAAIIVLTIRLNDRRAASPVPTA